MQAYIEHVEAVLEDLRQGKMIILTDNPERENEGDFIFPAEMITPEKMNFIIRHSSGIVCLSLFEEHMKKLDLSYMVPVHENTSLRGTPFAVSIDARSGISTGVSAQDRVQTVLAAINDHVKPEDLVRPGHIFPLYAKDGGVLERPGHTEGSVDLMKLAGLKHAALLCEVMNPDGTMARGNKLQELAKSEKIKILSMEDLVAYRKAREDLIAEEVSTEIPLETYGTFNLTVVKEKITDTEHVVLEKKARNQQQR